MKKKTLFICIIIAVSFIFAAAFASGLLRLPSGLKSIETEAFCGDTSLYEVFIPEGITSIDERAFADSSVEILHFPESLTAIADDAFSGVSSWRAYAFKNSYAYKWCKKNNIEVRNADPLSVSDDFSLPSGVIVAGELAEDLYAGTIFSYPGIRKITFSLYSNDTCIDTLVIDVNGESFSLKEISDQLSRKLLLLPPGNYRIEITAELMDGAIKGSRNYNKWNYIHDPWVFSDFSIAAPPGTIENTDFDSRFSLSPNEVSPKLRSTSMELADAAYREWDVIQKLSACGFWDIKTDNYISGEHTCGVAFGWKNIFDRNGKPKRLIAVICRGTMGDMFGGSPEWSSNFTIGDGKYHTGFFGAAVEIHNWLSTYYLDFLYKEGLTNDDIIIWTTGHSRGAAVSNLLAGTMLNGIFPEDQIYCYTYATPNVTRSSDLNRPYIHNYIIGGDLVARVPLNAWGYHRYGIDHIYHNGETINGVAVIDEGVMTFFCKTISSQRILDKLRAEGIVKAAIPMLIDLGKSAFGDLFSLNTNTISSTTEIVGYIENTHEPRTYQLLANGNYGNGYWSNSYLKIDDEGPKPWIIAKSTSASSVTLECGSSQSYKLSNTYFEIRYAKSGTSGWANSKIIKGSTSYEITGLEPNTEYAFDVVVMYNGIRSKRSDTNYATTKKIKLKSTGVTTTSVSLSWDDLPGYLSYEIRYDKSGVSGWKWSQTVYGTRTIITGLLPNTKYAFDICAVQGNKKTKPSDTIHATTAGFDLKAAASPTSVRLSWNAVANASSYEIRYKYPMDSLWRWSKTVTGTSTTISGLEQDTAYAFDIRANVNGEWSDRSDTVLAATPKLKKPGKFKTTSVTETTVTLSWAAVPEATSYEIRYDYRGVSGWKWSKTTSGTSITITGLEPGKEYAFDICSVCEGCRSARSDPIYPLTTALKVPSGFRVVSTTGASVTLAWDKVTVADSYEIRYKFKAADGWSWNKSVKGTTVTITGLTPGSDYDFGICTVYEGHKSKWCKTINASTAKLKIPDDFRVTGKTASSVTLAWDAVSGADSYEIRYDYKGASGWRWSKSATGTSVTITGLEPGSDYAFGIRAIYGDHTSAWLKTTIYASTPKLKAPSGFHVESTTETSVTLAWNNASSAESYEIRYDYKNASGWEWSKSVTGRSVTITGLEPGRDYAFDICTVYKGYKSSRSDTIYASTPKVKVPANFKVTGKTETSVTLAWDKVSSADSYEIRYEFKGVSGWRWSKSTTGTSVTITGLDPGEDYAFDICTVYKGYKSSRSKTIYATTTKLKVPADFRVTGKTETSVTLAWSAVSAVDSYEIRYDYKNASGWQWKKSVTGTSVTITGLEPNSNYAFDICTVYKGYRSSRSDTIYASTPKVKVPANFRVTGKTETSVTLAWDKVSSADSYEIRYDYKNASGWQWKKTVTGTSVTITGLEPDSSYAFDICSVCSGYKSARSDTIYASTPKLKVPGNFRVTATTETSVTLAWNAVSVADSYEIRYEFKNVSGWRWSKSATGTSVTITGLDPDSNYAFDICTVYNGNKSARSDTIYASTPKLKVPGNFRVTGKTETSVSLAWNSVSAVDSYEIRYDYKNASGWQWKKSVTGTSVTITGLEPGCNFAFDICTVYKGNRSSRSDTIYASTPSLGIPGNFRVTGRTETSVTLAWNSVSAAESYQIRYDYKNASGWQWKKTVTGTSLTISGLLPGRNYAFDICSVKSGFLSGRSSTIYASTPDLKIPSGFRYTDYTETTVSLTWGSVAGAASYEIRYDKKGASGWAYSVSTSGTSATITGLNPGQAYAFDIRAVQGSSSSGRSDTIYVTTKTLKVPSGFKYTGTTVSSVSLSWSAVPAADSYEIRWDKKGTSGWRYSKTVTGTSVTITGLIPDTAYAFDICSVKNGKMSGRSDTIYASTKVLAKPSGFSGSSGSKGSITLSWNAVSGGVAGYRIRYDLKGTSGWDYSVKTTGTSVTITGLKSGKTYAFQILSYYGSYEGSWSSTIYITAK